MKQKISLIVFLFSLTTLSLAQERSIAEVLDIFGNLFMQEQRQKAVNDNNLRVEPLTKDGKTYMYVVNNNNFGWAIISNEQQYTKIIGYSKTGSFSTEKTEMPCGLKLLLDHHCNMIDSIRSNNTKGQQRQVIKSRKQYLPASPSNYTLGSILLVKNGAENFWKQSHNNYSYSDCSKVYNKFCPAFYTESCEHCIVGCSAVALGQILWYWQWPDYADIPNKINRYGGVYGGTIKRYYDWDNMPSSIQTSTNMYQVDAIAKFLRDCGYAEEMWYGGNDWSMAGIAKIKRAMERNFNLHYNNVHEYSWVDMETILIEEIENSRPVLCQAWSDTAVNAHSFVIDGYNIVSDEVKYHINFGWGYGYNNFYDLGFGTYNINRTFLTEIYPDCSVRGDIINGISETQIISDTIANYYSTADIILNQTNSPLTIESGGHLIAESGSTITIKPGFQAKMGSNIRLSVKDLCTTSGGNKAMPANYHYNNEKLALSQTQLIISPNPAKDIISISSQEQIDNIRIYTVTGQCILQTKQAEIDISTLQTGLYIINATTTDGNMLQSKFVHQ